MTNLASEKTDIDPRLTHARRVCQANGERLTPLRAHIFELLLAEDGPVKAYDLLDKLKPEHGSPKPPTVYRALDFFSRLGLVHKVEMLNAYIPCDHTSGEGDSEDDAHQHGAEFFICETCESVEEREAHNHAGCAPGGFQIRRSVIEHYGRCQSCLKQVS